MIRFNELVRLLDDYEDIDLNVEENEEEKTYYLSDKDCIKKLPERFLEFKVDGIYIYDGTIGINISPFTYYHKKNGATFLDDFEIKQEINRLIDENKKCVDLLKEKETFEKSLFKIED